jgi:hypothetical protein
VNWTAARAGPTGPDEDAAGAAGVAAAPLAHAEVAVGDAPAGRAGVVDRAGVDELADVADVAAQPAARPATARATRVEYTALRVINGVSLVTFARTLSRLTRLQRTPNV